MPDMFSIVLAMIEKYRDARPKIYYGTSDLVEPGVSFVMEASQFYPKFFVCHPNELDAIKQQLTGMNVIPIEEYRPSWQLPGLLCDTTEASG